MKKITLNNNKKTETDTRVVTPVWANQDNPGNNVTVLNFDVPFEME